MSRPFYFFRPNDNVAPSALWTWQTGAEDAAYPATNAPLVGQETLAAPAKSTATTAALMADWGAAKVIAYVVVWSNLDAAVAARLQFNATNSWGAPTVDIPLTIPARRADGYAVKLPVDVRATAAYLTGLRYMRITAGPNSNPVALKVLAYNTVRQVRDFTGGLRRVDSQVDVTMRTDSLVKWSVDLGAAPRMLAGRLLLSNADDEAVREWVRACGGRVKLGGMQPLTDVADFWPVYVSDGGMAPQGATLSAFRHESARTENNVNEINLQVEEPSIGDPEWE